MNGESMVTSFLGVIILVIILALAYQMSPIDEKQYSEIAHLVTQLNNKEFDQYIQREMRRGYLARFQYQTIIHKGDHVEKYGKFENGTKKLVDALKANEK
jgi:uncharacterized membrane protein